MNQSRRYAKMQAIKAETAEEFMSERNVGATTLHPPPTIDSLGCSSCTAPRTQYVEPSTSIAPPTDMHSASALKELIGDHVFFSALIAAFIWGVGSVSATFSFAVGSALGLMYLVLLAQFVQRMEEGGGASSGRFAIVFLLILLGGKNKVSA